MRDDGIQRESVLHLGYECVSLPERSNPSQCLHCPYTCNAAAGGTVVSSMDFRLKVIDRLLEGCMRNGAGQHEGEAVDPQDLLHDDDATGLPLCP